MNYEQTKEHIEQWIETEVRPVLLEHSRTEQPPRGRPRVNLDKQLDAMFQVRSYPKKTIHMVAKDVFGTSGARRTIEEGMTYIENLFKEQP